MTKEQAGMVAVLVQSVRTSWDTRAITAALADLRNLDLADVTHAAIRVAEDPDMRTPAAIAFLDPKHWRPTIRETETPEHIQRRAEQARGYSHAAQHCNLCDEDGWLPIGVRCPHDGLTAEARAERARKVAAAARAAIRPPKLSLCICPTPVAGFVPGCPRHNPDGGIGQPQKPSEPTEEPARA